MFFYIRKVTFGLFSGEKPWAWTPGEKNTSLLCADQAANPIFRLYDVIASRSHNAILSAI